MSVIMLHQFLEKKSQNFQGSLTQSLLPCEGTGLRYKMLSCMCFQSYLAKRHTMEQHLEFSLAGFFMSKWELSSDSVVIVEVWSWLICRTGRKITITGSFFCFLPFLPASLGEKITSAPASTEFIRQIDLKVDFRIVYCLLGSHRKPNEVSHHISTAHALGHRAGPHAIQVGMGCLSNRLNLDGLISLRESYSSASRCSLQPVGKKSAADKEKKACEHANNSTGRAKSNPRSGCRNVQNSLLEEPTTCR
ncbi:hypothetical protein OPV22_018398 [Ensete ventricosum]|uniref:Uncharacterized protein n=1 Tax=Ensete ventricosum TaxID=4639 RepID=A0AAV8R4F9_ENSVE|nr:hypothetical protein OPV22_018398 [Ensete ventricosum]